MVSGVMPGSLSVDEHFGTHRARFDDDRADERHGLLAGTARGGGGVGAAFRFSVTSTVCAGWRAESVDTPLFGHVAVTAHPDRVLSKGQIA